MKRALLPEDDPQGEMLYQSTEAGVRGTHIIERTFYPIVFTGVIHR